MRSKRKSPFDDLAFLIVECNTPLPYEVAIDLNAADPLFEAIVKAWNTKVKREKHNNAFLASCFYNAMGAKPPLKPSDFLPRDAESVEAEDLKLKSFLVDYSMSHGVTPPKTKK